MTKKELISLVYDVEAEACDRVWLHRKYPEDYADGSPIKPVIQEVLDTYGLKFGEQSDFDYHFWEGVLACCRLFSYNLAAKEFGVDQLDVSALRDYGIDLGFLDS